MTIQDVLELAQHSNPKLMEKTALALRLTEQLIPEFAPEIVADFQVIAESVSSKSKTASEASFMGSVARKAGEATLLGLGAAVATDLYNASRRGLSSGRNWKRMIAANPQLKEREAAEVRKAFGSLQRHAPDVAADPLAAGAAVTTLMNQPEGNDFMSLTSLVEAQKKKMDSLYRLGGGGGGGKK